jgi:hypothetical protein
MLDADPCVVCQTLPPVGVALGRLSGVGPVELRPGGEGSACWASACLGAGVVPPRMLGMRLDEAMAADAKTKRRNS